MVWDPVFGWDTDRMRQGLFIIAFFCLLAGFISWTDGGAFIDPFVGIYNFAIKHDAATIAAGLILLMAFFWWWKGIQGEF